MDKENKNNNILAIAGELSKLCDTWGLQISRSRMILIANASYELYQYDTILDLCKAIRDASTGKHGTTYNNITPADVKGWMDLHLEEKYLEKESQLRKAKEDEDPKDELEIYKEMQKKYEMLKKQTAEESEKPKDEDAEFRKFRSNWVGSEGHAKSVEEVKKELEAGD